MLLTAVRDSFARRILGRDRKILLAAAADEPPPADPAAARAATLHAKIKDLDRQQANIVAELRAHQPIGEADIDRQWRDQLRDAFAQIATQRKTAERQLASTTKPPEPTNRHDPAILDQLRVVEGDLANLPEDLERDLWAKFHLQVRYHQPTRRATIRTTIDERIVQDLASARQTIIAHVAPAARIARRKTEPSTSATAGGVFSLAGSAPGGSRTTWERPTTADNMTFVVIDGTWPLPPKG
jgi:site-specific DNA recombinase